MPRSLFVPLLLAAWLPSLAHAAKLAVIPTQFDETAQGQVPALFDDYLLTAIQNIGGFEVIGQDDISALLGFEKQRDIIDCTDTSCIADIGGALGVDKIVIVKIARLGTDWVATAKMINIRETKVEARVNEIVPGEVKDLLRSVPVLVDKLFGKVGGPAPVPAPPSDVSAAPARSTTQSAPMPTAPAAPPMPHDPATTPRGPDDSFGGGARVGGTIMMISGTVGWSIGAILTTLGVIFADTTEEIYTDFIYLPGVILFIAGQVITGVGAKIRANGNARRDLADADAVGSPKVFWLGWMLAAFSWGIALITPPVFTAIDFDMDLTTVFAPLAVLCAVGSTVVFMVGGFGAYEAEPGQRAEGSITPVPSIGLARLRDGNVVPTASLGFVF